MSQVDDWLAFNDEQLQSTDFKILDGAFKTLNKHLTLRSYITGYRPTVADFIIWGSLKGELSDLHIRFQTRGVISHTKYDTTDRISNFRQNL